MPSTITPPSGFKYIECDTRGCSLASKLRSRLTRSATGARPRRFRLIQCSSFLDGGLVRLFESETDEIFSQLAHSEAIRDEARYAVISHSSMGFEGADDLQHLGSSDLLHAACLGCRARSPRVPYLWIDRICIVEGDAADREWHVANLASIYRHADLCIVAPGNLARSPEVLGLESPSRPPHVFNAWTLLEAHCAADASQVLAKLQVLHTWTAGGGRWKLLDPVRATTLRAIEEYAVASNREPQSKTLQDTRSGPIQAIYQCHNGEKTCRWALSPLVYLLEGALDGNGLYFDPSTGPGEKPQAEHAKVWRPHLFGDVGTVSKQDSRDRGKSGKPYLGCETNIRLLLAVLEAEACNWRETNSRRYCEGYLLSAFMRYYNTQNDLAHILCSILRPDLPSGLLGPTAQAFIGERSSAEDAAWLTKSLVYLLTRSESSRRSEGRHLWWLWLLSPAGIQSTHKAGRLPCFAPIHRAEKAAWRTSAVPHTRTYPSLRSPEIWLGTQTGRFAADSNCQISYTSSGATTVSLTARAIRVKADGRDSRIRRIHWPFQPEGEEWFLYAGDWKSQAERSTNLPYSDGDSHVLLLVVKKLEPSTAPTPCYAHVGWCAVRPPEDAYKDFAEPHVVQKSFHLVVQ